MSDHAWRTVFERSMIASILNTRCRGATNDLSPGKTLAAELWCSKLSRERFSALALSWLNLPCALKPAIAYGKRTLKTPSPLCRATAAAARGLLLLRAPTHGPNGGIADSLDEAMAAFRAAWERQDGFPIPEDNMLSLSIISRWPIARQK